MWGGLESWTSPARLPPTRVAGIAAHPPVRQTTVIQLRFSNYRGIVAAGQDVSTVQEVTGMGPVVLRASHDLVTVCDMSGVPSL